MTPEDAAKVREDRIAFEDRRLTDHAYQQRRAMLFVSLVAFAVTGGGLQLSEIRFAGVSLTKWDDNRLVLFLLAVLVYLVGNFVAIARPEVLRWQGELEQLKVQLELAVRSGSADIQQGISGLRSVITPELAQTEAGKEVLAILSKLEPAVTDDVPKRLRRYIRVHRARIWFEYYVPASIGAAVCLVVIAHAISA